MSNKGSINNGYDIEVNSTAGIYFTVQEIKCNIPDLYYIEELRGFYQLKEIDGKSRLANEITILDEPKLDDNGSYTYTVEIKEIINES